MTSVLRGMRHVGLSRGLLTQVFPCREFHWRVELQAALEV